MILGTSALQTPPQQDDGYPIRLPASTQYDPASGENDRTNMPLLRMGAREFDVVPVNHSRPDHSQTQRPNGGRSDGGGSEVLCNTVNSKNGRHLESAEREPHDADGGNGLIRAAGPGRFPSVIDVDANSR